MSILEMIVPMDCAGCESKIKKALQKLDGVSEVDVDMAMQKVTVMGWVDQEKVLKTVRKKTGRRAELWPYTPNPPYQDFSSQYYYQHHQQAEPVSYYAPQSASSYNYHMYSYNGQAYSQYPQMHYSTNPEPLGVSMFSEENPHACSIM